MAKLYKFPRSNRVPEQEKDYAPILRDRVIIPIERPKYGLISRALLWAVFFLIYGFLFASIYGSF